MNKLRPIGEVAGICLGRNEKAIGERIQVDREAVVEACVDAALEYTGHNVYATVFDDQLKAAILAVAKPSEDPRERLGRVVRKTFCDIGEWGGLREHDKEQYRKVADAVIDEQRKIEEEA